MIQIKQCVFDFNNFVKKNIIFISEMVDKNFDVTQSHDEF
jgi:hypothetical protein